MKKFEKIESLKLRKNLKSLANFYFQNLRTTNQIFINIIEIIKRLKLNENFNII